MRICNTIKQVLNKYAGNRGKLDVLLVWAVIGCLLAAGCQARAHPSDPSAAQAAVSGRGWTLAVLPDPQHYSQSFPGIWHLQTQWLVENRDALRIAYAVVLGDITNDNSDGHWERAKRGLSRLDGKIPYALAAGNHDYAGNTKSRETGLNRYFPAVRSKAWPGLGGVMEEGHVENCYHRFRAGGQDWLILVLEWGPRDKALEWADRVLKENSHCQAIVITHAYLYFDNTRYDWASKGKEQKWNPHSYPTEGGVNDGEEMWQKLLSKHANVFMVLCGHVPEVGRGFSVSRGENGNPVYELMADYQRRQKSGEGYLVLLQFEPEERTVTVRTYSPLTEEYLTGPEEQFVIRLDTHDREVIPGTESADISVTEK